MGCTSLLHVSGHSHQRCLSGMLVSNRLWPSLGPHRLYKSQGRIPRPAAYYEQDIARAVTQATGSIIVRQPRSNGNAVSDLLYKLQLCFRIFFPEKPQDVTPKEEVKRRLKMVLVADRCGMSPGSLGELKKTIARALQDFVDIESEEAIEVQINDDPGLGTVYCVAIPVRRVRAETRFAADEFSEHDGVLLEWDPTDLHSDPSSRFPMGC